MSSPRLLLKVQDTFALKVGLLVVPEVDFGADPPKTVNVELRGPNGARRAVAQVLVARHPPVGTRVLPPHTLVFPELGKHEVPIGTEIWLVDAV